MQTPHTKSYLMRSAWKASQTTIALHAPSVAEYPCQLSSVYMEISNHLRGSCRSIFRNRLSVMTKAGSVRRFSATLRVLLASSSN